MPNWRAKTRAGRHEEVRRRAGRRVARAARNKKAVEIEFKVAKLPQGVKSAISSSATICRLGQVVTNLIENARSFVARATQWPHQPSLRRAAQVRSS